MQKKRKEGAQMDQRKHQKCENVTYEIDTQNGGWTSEKKNYEKI